MKIGIISFHFVNNFGGALQAYALSSALKAHFTSETVIINYKNPFITFTDTVRILPISFNIRTILSGIRTIPKRIRRVRKFRYFIKQYCDLSYCTLSVKKLHLSHENCDAYICGSDQIWNPKITLGLCGAYFLDFVPTGKKKIAYAPSFGTNTLSKKNREKVKRYLDSFDSLSARESDGTLLLQEITGRDVERLIDPTFLLNREEWACIAKQTDIKGEYILLYIMQADPSVYTYARKLKEILGIRVIEISRYGRHYDFIDTVLVDVGPAEFLGLFEKAAFVCTNSFHGLCFSLIFQKKFFLVPSRRFSNRLSGLIDTLDIHDLYGNSVEDMVRLDFNWKHISETIEMERRRAFAYLQKSLEGVAK